MQDNSINEFIEEIDLFILSIAIALIQEKNVTVDLSTHRIFKMSVIQFLSDIESCKYKIKGNECILTNLKPKPASNGISLHKSYNNIWSL